MEYRYKNARITCVFLLYCNDLWTILVHKPLNVNEPTDRLIPFTSQGICFTRVQKCAEKYLQYLHEQGLKLTFFATCKKLQVP